MKRPIVFVCLGAALAGFAADAAAKWRDPFCQDKHEIPPFFALATSASSLSATDAFAYHSITGEERSGPFEWKNSDYSRVNSGS